MKRSDVPDAEVLAACRAFHAGETRLAPDEALAHKYPAKVILAKMRRMVERGQLDYGVSLRTAWPVEGERR